ncbi:MULTISPECIES: hypothetical protein [Pseudomonadaceae]|nr:MULTISPECIES: hypothetical protein [Pseudomonas]
MDGESFRILLTVLSALGASLGVRWYVIHHLAREDRPGDDDLIA